MKRIIVSLAIIAACSACRNEAQEVTRNGDFQLELLFEQDGCKMYRFKDGRRYVYWSNCSGNVQSSHTTRRGKASTKRTQQTITTVAPQADTNSTAGE